MHGNRTELTARLEICRKQFFQWHFVEKRSIPEVKEKFDELTNALLSAGYPCNFIAGESKWKSRSTHWNARAKSAWNVKNKQKGSGLRIPAELASVPIWIQNGQDVGDWRNKRSNDNHHSDFPELEAHEHRQIYQSTGDWNGLHQIFPRPGDHGTSEASRPSLSGSPSSSRALYPSDPTRHPGTTLPPPNTGTAHYWPQYNFDCCASGPPPLPTHPERTRNDAPQVFNHGPSPYYQSYQTAPPTPNAILPCSNPPARNDRDLTSFMNDMELSHMPVEGWPRQGSESTVQDYPQHRTSYQDDYAQQSSGSNHPDRQVRPRSTGQWGGYQYDPTAPDDEEGF